MNFVGKSTTHRGSDAQNVSVQCPVQKGKKKLKSSLTTQLHIRPCKIVCILSSVLAGLLNFTHFPGILD